VIHFPRSFRSGSRLALQGCCILILIACVAGQFFCAQYTLSWQDSAGKGFGVSEGGLKGVWGGAFSLSHFERGWAVFADANSARWLPKVRRHQGLFIPFWMPAAGAVVVVLLARRGGNTHGNCLSCGYSLAGLPRGSRCPECGTQFVAVEKKRANSP
jgi:hypothetical protein